MWNHQSLYPFPTMKDIVMTLDAGGTNLVFSAIQGGKEIIRPIVLPSITDDLSTCLATLRSGFEQIRASLTETPAAISFAFPGPADYEAGIIGDLPNFPAFRGGVPLGPYLEEYFGIPVFINNDGNLFAYGEALAGILPEINLQLQNAGNPKRYKNLIGVTLGTGFGGGIVINGKLLIGDNQLANSLWCQPNICHPEWIAEESVSIRGIQRIYAQLSGDSTLYSPKEIFEIAENSRQGDNEAAIAAFSELGKVAGQVLASALLLIDGIVVIGGGVAGAAKYILPALMNELKGETGMANGTHFLRLQREIYNWEEAIEREEFLHSNNPRTIIALSHLGASRAIAAGAYYFALKRINH